MTNLEALVAGIEKKAALLVEDNARLRAAEQEMRLRLQTLQEQTRQLNETITNLKEENRKLKLGEMLARKGDSTELKLKINQLVRSIDKSLAIINSSGQETAQN
jgi:uncharacterized protein (DUF3084 family)